MSATPQTQSLVRYILRHWIVILVVTAVGGIGAYLYARTLPEYFKSTINCVPARNDQGLLGGALGGLSSALKDFGLTKLTGQTGESYEFVVVLFTRSIRDSMIKRFDLVKEYELEGEPMRYVREELEDNIEVELHAEGNYEITIWSRDPNKAVDMCSTFVSYANTVANNIQRKDAEKTSFYLEARIEKMDSALAALTDSLSRYGRDYLMFSPLDQAAASASAFADSKAAIMEQETILGLLESNYGPGDPQVQAQRVLVGEMQKKFTDMQTKPGFAGNFTLSDAGGIGASYMRLVGEFEAYTKLKAFLLPTLEQARLDRMKTTPSLLVVDEPILAEKKDRPKRALIAAGSGIGAGILTIMILFSIHAWRDFMGSAKKDVKTEA